MLLEYGANPKQEVYQGLTPIDALEEADPRYRNNIKRIEEILAAAGYIVPSAWKPKRHKDISEYPLLTLDNVPQVLADQYPNFPRNKIFELWKNRHNRWPNLETAHDAYDAIEREILQQMTKQPRKWKPGEEPPSAEELGEMFKWGRQKQINELKEFGG